MNWKKYYKQHLMSAEDAVNYIQSGNRVVVVHVCDEPPYLLDVMVANTKAYKDVEIVHMVVMGEAEYCKPEYAGSFRHNAFFVDGTSRNVIAEDRGDFILSSSFEVSRQFSSTMPVDVAMVTMTPPDENGMCSLGMLANYTLEAVKQAELVIAQMNLQVFWTSPYNLVSIKNLSCIVEHETLIVELRPPKIGDIEKTIGECCASLVPDGATFQLDIGTTPDTILLFLEHGKDLGIHSEMFLDGVMELAKAGVITNAKKTLRPGKFEVAFLMGTRRLYNFVDHNPDMGLRPVGCVNNPFVIVQDENMVFINSYVQVNLIGQVASESIGPKQIFDVDDRVNFIHGVSTDKGGVSIMAVPSTVRGKISGIVPLLDGGAAAAASHSDVDYITTEYGVAALKDQTLRQHARNSIETAHPDFRGELKAEYEERFRCKY